MGLDPISWAYIGATAIGAVSARNAHMQGKEVAGAQQYQFQQATELEAEKIRQANELATMQLDEQKRIQAANLSAASRAAAESKALMDKQLKAQDEAMNRANQKRPNTRGILEQAQQAGKSGASGTMLTGPQGVDTGSLQLGKATLLGQ